MLKHQSFLELAATCNKSECYEWPFFRQPEGYGKIGHKIAHRMSYEMHIGPIPKGLLVMHSCDNPPCCNPHHLQAGTHKDNVQDMIKKGRRAKRYFPEGFSNAGELHGRSKLTEKTVNLIRKEYQDDHLSHRKLAAKYGTSKRNIENILHNRTWRHLI